MSYRICPYCGAALDPGERCDCKSEAESQTIVKSKKIAAPVGQHRNGKGESEVTRPTFTSDSTKRTEENQ